jgi:hypothetical protein
MDMEMVQEDDHSGKVIALNDWSKLPRSVRWRLQLGILSEPPPDGQDQDLSLDVLFQHNKSIVSDLGEKFKELVTKHVEEDEDGGNNNNDDDGTEADNNSGKSNGGNEGGNAHATEIDPLTAMVMEEQARETRKAELYLKYRKERARRKRGLTTEARIIESESDEVDRASVSFLVFAASLQYNSCMFPFYFRS